MVGAPGFCLLYGGLASPLTNERLLERSGFRTRIEGATPHPDPSGGQAPAGDPFDRRKGEVGGGNLCP